VSNNSDWCPLCDLDEDPRYAPYCSEEHQDQDLYEEPEDYWRQEFMLTVIKDLVCAKCGMIMPGSGHKC